mgnify:CR=1 FL=1
MKPRRIIDIIRSGVYAPPNQTLVRSFALMKNTFGSSVSVTLFGESHGAEIGAVIDGLAPGH